MGLSTINVNLLNTFGNSSGEVGLLACANSGERYDQMPVYGYVISALVLLFIWIIGTVGNGMVILLITRNKETPLNFLLCNLAIAEFFITILGTPMNFSSAVYGAWVFGKTGCMVYGFVVGIGAITSIMTLTVLALERFLMIVRLEPTPCLQNFHSLLIIIGIWIYSLILTLPTPFGWTAYSSRAACLSCSINWESDSSPHRLIRFMLTFAIPTGIVIFSYVGILLTVFKSGMGQAVRKAEVRVGLMVGVMTIAFLVAWLPYAVTSLKGFKGNEVLDLIATLFAKTSTCYNPVIYVGLNSQFRLAWAKFVGKEVDVRDPSCSETVQGTENENKTS